MGQTDPSDSLFGRLTSSRASHSETFIRLVFRCPFVSIYLLSPRSHDLFRVNGSPYGRGFKRRTVSVFDLPSHHPRISRASDSISRSRCLPVVADQLPAAIRAAIETTTSAATDAVKKKDTHTPGDWIMAITTWTTPAPTQAHPIPTTQQTTSTTTSILGDDRPV